MFVRRQLKMNSKEKFFQQKNQFHKLKQLMKRFICLKIISFVYYYLSFKKYQFQQKTQISMYFQFSFRIQMIILKNLFIFSQQLLLIENETLIRIFCKDKYS
ncbi:unnamed protein product [Paramecium pentaurelia]|uniref:Uncharacterized protein n=1 Tax=Paramecium pentaurelia TaxID=43138 RepID=A0A8S1XAU5_9CILI|nr:unnamed protein product [Paramecium pentaurelia]